MTNYFPENAQAFDLGDALTLLDLTPRAFAQLVFELTLQTTTKVSQQRRALGQSPGDIARSLVHQPPALQEAMRDAVLQTFRLLITQRIPLAGGVNA
jgi:hypothetical protein